MTNIDDIVAELADAPVGTVVRVLGYVDSAGDKSDVEIELLAEGAYDRMLADDLKLLLACDVADLTPAAGDLALVDILAAREQLIKSRQTTLAQRSEGIRKAAEPGYHKVGPHTYKRDGAPGAVYVSGRRLEVSREKPAKGAIPRAKQHLGAVLDLPSRYYVHRIKLEPGKFDDVTIYEPWRVAIE